MPETRVSVFRIATPFGFFQTDHFRCILNTAANCYYSQFITAPPAENRPSRRRLIPSGSAGKMAVRLKICGGAVWFWQPICHHHRRVFFCPWSATQPKQAWFDLTGGGSPHCGATNEFRWIYFDADSGQSALASQGIRRRRRFLLVVIYLASGHGSRQPKLLMPLPARRGFGVSCNLDQAALHLNWQVSGAIGRSYWFCRR